MKEKSIAKMQLDIANKVLDCIDGKITARETLTFGGSHNVDISETEARLTKLVGSRPATIKDVVKDRNIKPESVKKKKA